MIVVFIYVYSIVFIMIFTFVSALGNVYIADRSNSRIRKVTVSTGIISTIAGSTSGSYSGDGGLATSAALYNPCGVGLDSSGNTSLNAIVYMMLTYIFRSR